MAVTPEEVKHVAALARLGITDAGARQLTAELNTILGHMDALGRVDTDRLEPVVGVGAERAPLRPDTATSVSLSEPLPTFAPSLRDGFFIVPRLATHETAEAS